MTKVLQIQIHIIYSDEAKESEFKIYELHEAINAAAIRVATIMREHIPVGKKCSIVSADIIGTEQ